MRRRDALATLAVLVAPAVATSGDDSGPRIRVEPESFDFGRVRPRQTLRKEFRLMNLGAAPLVIERISRSCGCTKAATEVDRLEPGGSTPLRVVMETRSAAGPVENHVLLRSNDPETPSLEVRLRATVVAEE